VVCINASHYKILVGAKYPSEGRVVPVECAIHMSLLRSFKTYVRKLRLLCDYGQSSISFVIIIIVNSFFFHRLQWCFEPLPRHADYMLTPHNFTIGLTLL